MRTCRTPPAVLALGLAAAASSTAACGDSGASSGDADAGAPEVDAASGPRQFYWADWTAATVATEGTADGTLTPPAGAVTVAYAGEVYFAQTDGGTNFWVPGDPYVNDVTANAPEQPDIIALVNPGDAHTLTFSQPVEGLVMGIVSLGQPASNVKYVFDSPIDLLSYGVGYWGDGLIEIEGDDTISGSEGHGAIQFTTAVSSVSWTVVGGEAWHGFTVGIPDQ